MDNLNNWPRWLYAVLALASISGILLIVFLTNSVVFGAMAIEALSVSDWLYNALGGIFLLVLMISLAYLLSENERPRRLSDPVAATGGILLMFAFVRILRLGWDSVTLAQITFGLLFIALAFPLRNRIIALR